MKPLKLTSLIGALLFVINPHAALVSLALAMDSPSPRAQDRLNPQTDPIVIYNATIALRHLASARSNIARNNIPGSQSDLGKALTNIGQMKARFPAARLQELIAAARIRLTYQEPSRVLQYLQLLSPTLEEVSEPAAASEVKRALDRSIALLKISDKEAADRELADLMDLLIYQSPLRPVALAEKHLLTAASELEKQHRELADRAIASSENYLNGIAFGMYSPYSETQKSLRQALVDHAAGRWAAVQNGLERASGALEQSLKDASLKGRAELQDFNADIRSLVARSAPTEHEAANTIKALWQRGESLAERALDYQTANLAKLQSSRADANDLIEAKLHVAYAEVYEFTTGEMQKSATELDKAEASLRKAAPAIRKNEEAEIDGLEKDIRVLKAELSKNASEQRVRYETVKDNLSQLIH